MCRIDVTGENVNIRMNKELNVRIEVKRTKKTIQIEVQKLKNSVFCTNLSEIEEGIRRVIEHNGKK